MACLVGVQSQVNLAKGRKHAPIMTSPTENPKNKIEIFFI